VIGHIEQKIHRIFRGR